MYQQVITNTLTILYAFNDFQLDVCTLYSSSIQSNLSVQFIGKWQTSHS